MNLEKFNIVKLSDGKKIIILEKFEYENTTYFYVDDVKEDETDTLDNYYVMRLNPNNSLVVENDVETLTKIIPILNKLVKEDYK